MMKAIRAALDPSDSQEHVRIVCFMTDGYVGNDMEIISEVQKHPNARVFSLGFGELRNRFLLDKMAEHGRGEVEYVAEGTTPRRPRAAFTSAYATRLLTDISVDWEGVRCDGRLPETYARPLRREALALSRALRGRRARRVYA